MNLTPWLVGLIVFIHANVVDVGTGAIRRDQTIVIVNNRIMKVDGGAPPRGARVVDLHGAYVIPGLWDMHAHILRNYEQEARGLLPYGVTGIRHPGNSRLDTLRSVKLRISRDSGFLPRLVAAGPLIDGPPPVHPNGSVVLGRAEDAPLIADSLLRNGVDFFKIYAHINREPFFAIAAEAKKRGVRLAGHIPNLITPVEMAEAGAASIEHMHEFTRGCSSRETEMGRLRNAGEESADYKAVRIAVMDTLLSTYDRNKCQRVAAALVKNHTFVTPTLYLWHLFRFQDYEDFVGKRPVPIPEFTDTVQGRRVFNELIEILHQFSRAGVQYLAGTDAPTAGVVPGISLHRELRTLVEDAGFTPLQALQSATLNPARYFAATDSLGSIASGRLADLVFLSANPLTDIRNTEKIVGVVMNGYYRDRDALRAMLVQLNRVAPR